MKKKLYFIFILMFTFYSVTNPLLFGSEQSLFKNKLISKDSIKILNLSPKSLFYKSNPVIINDISNKENLFISTFKKLLIVSSFFLISSFVYLSLPVTFFSAVSISIGIYMAFYLINLVIQKLLPGLKNEKTKSAFLNVIIQNLKGKAIFKTLVFISLLYITLTTFELVKRDVNFDSFPLRAFTEQAYSNNQNIVDADILQNVINELEKIINKNNSESSLIAKLDTLLAEIEMLEQDSDKNKISRSTLFSSLTSDRLASLNKLHLIEERNSSNLSFVLQAKIDYLLINSLKIYQKNQWGKRESGIEELKILSKITENISSKLPGDNTIKSQNYIDPQILSKNKLLYQAQKSLDTSWYRERNFHPEIDEDFMNKTRDLINIKVSSYSNGEERDYNKSTNGWGGYIVAIQHVSEILKEKEKTKHTVSSENIDIIQSLKEIPVEKIEEINYAAKTFDVPSELLFFHYIKSSILLTRNYDIGSGIDTLIKRFNINIDMQFIKDHWPNFLNEIHLGPDLMSFCGGILFEGKATIGSYRMRPAWVRRYLAKEKNYSWLNNLSDRQISFRLLDDRFAALAMAAMIKGASLEVKDIIAKKEIGEINDFEKYIKEGEPNLFLENTNLKSLNTPEFSQSVDPHVLSYIDILKELSWHPQSEFFIGHGLGISEIGGDPESLSETELLHIDKFKILKTLSYYPLLTFIVQSGVLDNSKIFLDINSPEDLKKVQNLLTNGNVFEQNLSLNSFFYSRNIQFLRKQEKLLRDEIAKFSKNDFTHLNNEQVKELAMKTINHIKTNFILSAEDEILITNQLIILSQTRYTTSVIDNILNSIFKFPLDYNIFKFAYDNGMQLSTSA